MIYAFKYVILAIWILAYIGIGILLSALAVIIYRLIRDK